jgi:hypothetical protein
MKNHLRTVLFAALLAGCATSPAPKGYSGIPPTDITATVTCSDPAMKFSGTIVSDGRTEKFSGTGHGTFHATGHEIICSFRKSAASGQITLSVSSSDNSHGTCNAGGFHCARAEILRALREQHDIFTSF